MSTKEETLEPHARYIGTVMLVINPDSSWSLGRALNNAVKVTYGDIGSINDSTFGYSAVAATTAPNGGYRLYVRSDANSDVIVEVTVAANGAVDPASLKVLSAQDVFATEDRLKVDLNDSGGFGAGSVLLQGGAVNLYLSELGHYQLGNGRAAPVTLQLGEQPLDDQLLPRGWKIVETVPGSAGFDVYAQDPSGLVFAAQFDAAGRYTGGAVLGGAALEAAERDAGVDIDGNNNLPAPAGWTSAITGTLLRAAVEQALSSTTGGSAAGTITHAELVGLMRSLIQARKDEGASIGAQDLADLQAVAERGQTVFAGNGPAAGYLSYVFGKLVEGSLANRFFNGGAAERSELGSLAAGSSVAALEKLVDKWLLGGDLPSPATAGDSATGAPKSVLADYARSGGSLFVDGIAVSDVNQGTAGDCYLIAAIGGLAVTNPQVLQAAFIENASIDGVRSWGVRFFDGAGKPHWVTVNDTLPVEPADNTKLAYSGPAGKSLNGEIWLPLMEKAYAQINSLGILPRRESTGQNSFAAIEGGFGDPLGALVGARVVAYVEPGTNLGVNDYLDVRAVDRSDAAALAQFEADLKAVVNAGKSIWVGVTQTLKNEAGKQLLVGGHAHFIIDAKPEDPNNSDVLVYNPWGLATAQGSDDHVSPALFTLAQLVGIAGLDFMVLDGPVG